MIDAQTQTYLTIAFVFGALALVGYVFKQRGEDIKVVAKTVPLEFAQFAFRIAAEKAQGTESTMDDDALKQAARDLGYAVIETANGGWTIAASATAVAQNAQSVKDDLYRG
jgi:hypothetical protein